MKISAKNKDEAKNMNRLKLSQRQKISLTTWLAIGLLSSFVFILGLILLFNITHQPNAFASLTPASNCGIQVLGKEVNSPNTTIDLFEVQNISLIDIDSIRLEVFYRNTNGNAKPNQITFKNGNLNLSIAQAHPLQNAASSLGIDQAGFFKTTIQKNQITNQNLILEALDKTSNVHSCLAYVFLRGGDGTCSIIKNAKEVAKARDSIVKINTMLPFSLGDFRQVMVMVPLIDKANGAIDVKIDVLGQNITSQRITNTNGKIDFYPIILSNVPCIPANLEITIESTQANVSAIAGTIWLRVGETLNPLSVELKNFEITKINQTAKITWETQSETNNDFFVIQRLRNLTEAPESIGQISGAGNTTEAINYDFTDYNPLNNTSYYRIVQQDFDGKRNAFPWQRFELQNQSNQMTIKAYPNPVRNFLNVEIDSSNPDAIVSLVNIKGQTVLAENVQINEKTTKRIDVSHLQSGIYNLKVSDKDHSEIKRIVIRK